MTVSANALVVDDEPSWSEVYQRALWRVGVDRVEVTDTYEGAATAIDALRFAVAVVDIGLAVDDDTNVDGLRVMEKIRTAGDPTSIKNAIELSFGVAAGGSISLGIDGERKGEITHAMRLTIAGPGTPAP